jgi:hypothetical protein
MYGQVRIKVRYWVEGRKTKTKRQVEKSVRQTDREKKRHEERGTKG